MIIRDVTGIFGINRSLVPPVATFPYIHEQELAFRDSYLALNRYMLGLHAGGYLRRGGPVANGLVLNIAQDDPHQAGGLIIAAL